MKSIVVKGPENKGPGRFGWSGNGLGSNGVHTGPSMRGNREPLRVFELRSGELELSGVGVRRFPKREKRERNQEGNL